MPIFTVYFTGTVIGKMIVEADDIEQAMIKAQESDDNIDIIDDPDDWTLDQAWTNQFDSFRKKLQ